MTLSPHDRTADSSAPSTTRDVGESPDAGPSSSPREKWLSWHSQREQTLREPHGWLSLTSLTWLGPEPTGVPDFPASWTALPLEVEDARAADRDGVGAGAPGTTGTEAGAGSAGGAGVGTGSGTGDEGGTPGVFRVTFEPGQGIDFTRGGVAVEGPQEWVLGPGDQDMSLARGELLAEVARRGDGVCVRVRDPHALTRTGFTGVPVWDFDPSWVRPATLTRLDTPGSRTVPGAQSGRTTSLTVSGRVHVSLPDGSAVDLDVVGPDEDEWGVIFHDPTNDTETSGWRRAPVTPTGETTAEVDFNRSVNFPAHFTPFGTCPTPIEGNTVPVPVRAGEKAPTPPGTV